MRNKECKNRFPKTGYCFKQKLPYFLLIIFYSLCLSSCSVSKKISRQADSILLSDSAISHGHIGICIYEPATGKYWYKYNADKYFIPASNTKLFTLYAGMKYLGDSLTGMKVAEYENNLLLIPTADPSFLHKDFQHQPVYDFLHSAKKKLLLSTDGHFFKPYGKGWAWDDYNSDDMTERSWFPMYGNYVVFSGHKNELQYYPKKAVAAIDLSDPLGIESYGYVNRVKRDWAKNNFDPAFGGTIKADIPVPFITSDELTLVMLKDTLHRDIYLSAGMPDNIGKIIKTYRIYSRPSDSLFIPMMHNSDNFFAEQVLLMASNEKLGYMSDDVMIDTLLSKELNDIPQKPRWVDGSGLSRYNLFTPMSFVYILDKMNTEFGSNRLKKILPTGGEGSLRNYYISDSSFIFAKTGTLSNNCALSGFLFTSKGKLLIFSVLVNNYQVGAAPIRRSVEHFLHGIREKY